MLFDFYFAKFNFLHFISTPSNHSPICVWFYLRYKIIKIIQSSVLSFLGVLKVADFLLPSLSQFSFYCWVENLLSGCSPPIMQGSFAYFSGCACTIPVPVIVLYLCHTLVSTLNSTELHLQGVAPRSQYSDPMPEVVMLQYVAPIIVHKAISQ